MGKNPTDRGKLGAKRSVLVEANGIPVGLAIDEVALLSKMVVDGCMDRGELLQGLHAAKAGHGPLSSSKR